MRVDLLEFVRERLGFRGLDRFFVHAARVIIAHLLHFGSRPSDPAFVLAAFSATTRKASLLFSISMLKLPQRDSSGGIGVFFSQAPLA